MASTYYSLHVHVVFATEGRAPMIDETWRQDLHRYMAGVIKGLEAKPIIVNGVADHVHVLMGIKPSQAISDLVRELKKASSNWAAARSRGFGWQNGICRVRS